MHGADRLPPTGRLAQSSQVISILRHECPHTPEEVALDCVVVTIRCQRGRRVERYVEEIVDATLAELVAGLLLVNRDVMNFPECGRQIATCLQVLFSLSRVVPNLPDMAAILPEARVRHHRMFQHHTRDTSGFVGQSLEPWWIRADRRIHYQRVLCEYRARTGLESTPRERYAAGAQIVQIRCVVSG